MPLLNTATKVYAGSTLAKAVFLGATKIWPPAAPPAGWGPEEHIFAAETVPPNTSPQSSPFTFGFRFTPAAGGRITGVRFYSYTAGTGRPVSIWSDSGVRLAHGTGGAEAGIGWQVIPLDTPLTVAAGVPLVVSYGWQVSWGQFGYNTAAVVSASPNLIAHKGLYSQGAMDQFPSLDGGMHYFADVVYEKSLSAPRGYADRIKSLAPLSYWRLGEPPGAPAGVDEMNLYGVTFTGAPTLGVVGLLADDDDPAMQVAGVISQGASAGNPQDYWLQALTLEAWIRTSGAGASYRGIIVKQDGYGLFAVDNVLSVYEWASGQAISSGVNIATGLPHHVVVVFQPSGSQMYLDGAPVGSAFNHTTQSHAHPLTIGYATFSGQEFAGVIDEVAIYNRALTAAEVAGNYQAGQS